LAAFEAARRHDRPTCFICYTVKGHGLPLQGHKDNHAGQLTAPQVEALRAAHGVRPGHEWEPFEGLDVPAATMRDFIRRIPFLAEDRRRRTAPALAVPEKIAITIGREASTQQGFGALLHELAKGESDLAAHLVTTSPDVTVSTNLGAWVNRRGLYAREAMVDVFRKEKIPSTFAWDFSPAGQHLELGIAESNLFIALSAFGLARSLHGRRIIPIGTLYDPFIYRGADALNYACYQNARFILAATPSGITLAGEGGAHQSIGTPLVGLAMPGLAAFEPTFVDELEVILRWAFHHVQKEKASATSPHDDEPGGSVYLRLSTRPIEQPIRTLDAKTEADIVAGGYWLRPPGPNCRLIVAASGAILPEAAAAVGAHAEHERDTALLAVTSTDRLHAGWMHAATKRERGEAAISHVESLLAAAPREARLVTVCDAHPAVLGWLGSVDGRRTRALGVETFGQTGSLAELYRAYRIDATAILAAARSLAD
ncbi:MAG: transketolase, partial [Phyllobacteriaceae bacterium]|nr:transketolase [Phyllobacteriaceae bacterium]